MDSDNYHTRIEDIQDDLPDRVIRDLRTIRPAGDLDDVSSQFTEDIQEFEHKPSVFSILGEVFVLFILLCFVLDKRVVKYVGEMNMGLPKNILFAIVGSLVFLLYKIILYFY